MTEPSFPDPGHSASQSGPGKPATGPASGLVTRPVTRLTARQVTGLVTGLMSRGFSNAYLLLTLAALFWAGNAIGGKFALGVITPTTLTFLRWAVATVLVGLIAAPKLRQDFAAARRHWRQLLTLGAVGLGAFNLSLYAALEYTTAINVTIEQSAMPILIILINYVLYRQRIRALQGLGIALTIAGVVLTVTHGNPFALLESGINRGDGIMVIAILLYSGYTVALRNRPAMHWLSLLFVLCVGAMLLATPFYLVEGIRDGFTVPPLRGWMIVGYGVLFPTLGSQLFFIRGVELIGANRAGVFINLVPIFGTVLAVLVLAEAFRLHHLLGLILVLGGITLVERYRRTEA